MRDASEPGLAGIEVSLTPVPSGSGIVQSGVTAVLHTGAGGSYNFTNVVPGDYVVTAHLAGAGIARWWDTDGSGDWLVAVTVPIGTAYADVAAVGSAQITGTVHRVGTGSLVPGAPVSCTWAGLDGMAGTPDDAVFSVAASSDAVFMLDGVPYGTYRCEAFDPESGVAGTVVAVTVNGPSAAANLTVDSSTAAATGATLPATGRNTWRLGVLGGGLLTSGFLFSFAIGRRPRRLPVGIDIDAG